MLRGLFVDQYGDRDRQQFVGGFWLASLRRAHDRGDSSRRPGNRRNLFLLYEAKLKIKIRGLFDAFQDRMMLVVLPCSTISLVQTSGFAYLKCLYVLSEVATLGC